MHLLIPAAGRGSRMGQPVNKLLLPVAGRPLLAWTLLAADAAHSIRWIGLVGQPQDEPAIAALLAELALATPVAWCVGGATRQESVMRGLAALPPGAERVLIHDGARCLASPALFDRCSAALATSAAIVAAVPVKDTIKQADATGQLVEKTIPRERLWAAQTPQGGQTQLLRDAHAWAAAQGIAVTDDAALFELRDIPVRLVPGEDTNLKITTPADLWLAEAMVKRQYFEHNAP